VATKTGWTASVTITAHAAGHTTLSGVAVTARWSGGISGTASCTTGAAGTCTITSGNIAKKSTSVTFNVTGAVRSAYVYQATNNHDPEGDSNGTAIPVARP
jgi:hypothetical protein